MSDWTPGPWLVADHTVYALDETGGCNRFSCSMQGGYSYHGRTVKERVTHRELAANARLIVAAPDLYEALARMVKIYDGMEDSMGDPCPAVDHSKIILAKARGETK